MIALLKILKTLDIAISNTQIQQNKNNEDKNINLIPLNQRGLSNKEELEILNEKQEEQDEKIFEKEEIVNINNKLFNIKTKTSIKNNVKRTQTEKYQLTR